MTCRMQGIDGRGLIRSPFPQHFWFFIPAAGNSQREKSECYLFNPAITPLCFPSWGCLHHRWNARRAPLPKGGRVRCPAQGPYCGVPTDFPQGHHRQGQLDQPAGDAPRGRHPAGPLAERHRGHRPFRRCPPATAHRHRSDAGRVRLSRFTSQRVLRNAARTAHGRRPLHSRGGAPALRAGALATRAGSAGGRHPFGGAGHRIRRRMATAGGGRRAGRTRLPARRVRCLPAAQAVLHRHAQPAADELVIPVQRRSRCAGPVARHPEAPGPERQYRSGAG